MLGNTTYIQRPVVPNYDFIGENFVETPQVILFSQKFTYGYIFARYFVKLLITRHALFEARAICDVEFSNFVYQVSSLT